MARRRGMLRRGWRWRAGSEQFAVDEIAAAAARDEKSVLDQLLIGQHDGVAADAKAARQRARRGQRAGCVYMAVEDCRGQLLAQLLLQADATVRADMEQVIHVAS
jgi:hypothetical protein